MIQGEGRGLVQKLGNAGKAAAFLSMLPCPDMLPAQRLQLRARQVQADRQARAYVATTEPPRLGRTVPRSDATQKKNSHRSPDRPVTPEWLKGLTKPTESNTERK